MPLDDPAKVAAVQTPTSTSVSPALLAPVSGGGLGNTAEQQPTTLFANFLGQQQLFQDLGAAQGAASLTTPATAAATTPPDNTPHPRGGRGGGILTNLVADPTFTIPFGSGSPWTVALPSSTDPYVTAGVTFPDPSFGGITSAQLGTTGYTNELSQAIFPTPSTSYTYEFDLTNPVGGTPTQFDALFDGVSVLHLVNTPADGGVSTHYSAAVTSSPIGVDIIQIVERHDPDYWYVTNVSVS
jgi:hypothetical protein